MNALVGRARGEADVRLPIDVEGRRGMKCKLLRTLASGRVPDDCRLVDTGAQDVVALFVPLQRENGALVLA